MIMWALFLILSVVGPAQAQSMTEIYLQSERGRLAVLTKEFDTLLRHEPKTDADYNRLGELRIEIKRVKGRIKSIEDDVKAKAQGPPQ